MRAARRRGADAVRVLQRELAAAARTKSRSLMELFLEALDREVAELHENGVRLRFIGDRKTLSRAAAGAHRRGRAAHGRQYRAASCRWR